MRGRPAGKKADVFLLALVGTRIRNPCTHRLARGHGVGIDRQRLGDLHALGQHAGLARGFRLRDHLAIEVDVIVIDLFRQTAGHEWRAALLPRRRFGAQVEQVGRRTVEVHPIAIDVHVLEQAVRVPACEIRVAEVGDLLAQLLLHLIGGQAEVQPHALHPFALEIKGAPRIRRQTRFLQRRIDAGIGGLELPGRDQFDHGAQIAIARINGRNAGSRSRKRQHDRQHRRQDQRTPARATRRGRFHEPRPTDFGASNCFR